MKSLALSLAISGKVIAIAAAALAVGAVLHWWNGGWQKADNAPESNPSANKNDPQDLV